MKNVEMPKMGDTMEEGKILRWIKQEGDLVKKGEPLAEVETDKVNIEIEAFASGTLRKILVSAGNSAHIGAPLPSSAHPMSHCLLTWVATAHKPLFLCHLQRQA